MGAAIVPIIILVAVLALVIAGLVALGRHQQQQRREVVASDAVHFRVPEGQDPASLLASLRMAGYDAAMTSADTDTVLSVPVASPGDREGVRSVIATAPLNPEGDQPVPHEVRFLDE
jgi:hypothetical protein